MTQRSASLVLQRSHPFFTIGHSTREMGEFIDLLRVAGVRLIVDVRTVPRSRANPQYNADVFADTLSASNIDYEHIAELGGLRRKSRGIPEDVNALWRNPSFHNYADYAMGELFRSGLSSLRALGHATPCAIMCAEAVWWRCHRRIIADYLIAGGEKVFHILAPNHIDPARMTCGAKVQPDGTLSYPRGSAKSHSSE